MTTHLSDVPGRALDDAVVERLETRSLKTGYRWRLMQADALLSQRLAKAKGNAHQPPSHTKAWLQDQAGDHPVGVEVRFTKTRAYCLFWYAPVQCDSASA